MQTRVQVTNRNDRKAKDTTLEPLEDEVAKVAKEGVDEVLDHVYGEDDTAKEEKTDSLPILEKLPYFGAKAKEKVAPPSTTLQCILNLTIQYFVLYTLLQVLRTVNQFSGDMMLGWQKIVETGCTTVTYAPALCVLFLGCRMRAIQLAQGD